MSIQTTPGRPARLIKEQRRQQRRAADAAKAVAVLRRRHRNWLLWGVALGVIVAVIATMMWTARTTSSTAVRVAPDFTLTDTSGKQIHLADYRGHNVVLYFSEGTGCTPCLTQMKAIEDKSGDFKSADVTVLPIVMNTAQQIVADMKTNDVTTPFLIDSTGDVSREYGVLGKGMHADLPGHGFVLIDKTGKQRWYGEYPSMSLSTDDLLKQVHQHLS
jgi:peroxiredoxin